MSYAIAKDDRTTEERESHPILWGGTDPLLSGWGEASGRPSYAFWACRLEDSHKVERWVRSRGDLLRVREVTADYRPSTDAHVHVYVVRGGHPALSS